MITIQTKSSQNVHCHNHLNSIIHVLLVLLQAHILYHQILLVKQVRKTSNWSKSIQHTSVVLLDCLLHPISYDRPGPQLDSVQEFVSMIGSGPVRDGAADLMRKLICSVAFFHGMSSISLSSPASSMLEMFASLDPG